MSTEQNIEVREMEIDDLAAVFHLGEKLFTPQEHPNLYRTWDEFEVVNFYISDPEFCFAAYEGENFVGFLLGTHISKAHTAWDYGHLAWLGVAKDYQRRGVAELLFESFREKLIDSGVRMMIIDTQADNKNAVCFFKKQGFSNPQKHIYMTLNLDA